MKIAAFTGTFDPFHIGHYDILKTTTSLFDKVFVVIGNNIAKNSEAELPKLALKNVEFVRYDGIITDFCQENDVDVLIRGARNAEDFQREIELATWNRELSGIETLIIPAKPQFAHISSSAIRELQAFGKDASKYVKFDESPEFFHHNGRNQENLAEKEQNEQEV